MARHPPETRYAQSSGAKIAYQVSSTGPPTWSWCPAWSPIWTSSGSRPGTAVSRALERGGRLIRLDKRGTGLSDPAAELPTTQERVRDLAAVVAAAKSSRAVLFGLSDGGRAAIAFAAANPSQTRGLILYGTSYRGPRAALLRRYRSMVRHWGQGQIVDLVAPSLASPRRARPEQRHAAERARGPAPGVPGPGRRGRATADDARRPGAAGEGRRAVPAQPAAVPRRPRARPGHHRGDLRGDQPRRRLGRLDHRDRQQHGVLRLARPRGGQGTDRR